MALSAAGPERHGRALTQRPLLETPPLESALPAFLDDLASSLESLQGAVATEALEALLCENPDWVRPSEWLHNFGLAQHAL